MGMYSYVRLSILNADNQQPIEKSEKRKIIQQLYQDRKVDPKEFASSAFDLDGNIIDSVTWYKVDENIQSFSQNFPSHIFIVRQRSAEEEFSEEGVYYTSFQQGQALTFDRNFLDSCFE
jgi:hypothetical protein